MAFEVFDKQLARADGEAWLTIQRKGVIALNRAAFAAIGEPKAVLLLFDRDLQRVGIQAVKAGSPNSYPLRLASNKASYLISGAAFCKHYGIDTSTSIRVPAGLLSGVLAADLNWKPSD